MTDNRTTELLQELRDLACDVNAAEIIDHVCIVHSQWTFDSQWLDSWHTEFDRIADKLEQAIADWNTRAERTCHVNELDALTQTLSMVDGRPWGECSECGCLTPTDSVFCIQCGAKVVGE